MKNAGAQGHLTTGRHYPIDDLDFFIRQLYEDFPGRVPDAAGFQFWMQRLNETNPDYRFLTNGFLQSDEYHFRFAEISQTP